MGLLIYQIINIMENKKEFKKRILWIVISLSSLFVLLLIKQFDRVLAEIFFQFGMLLTYLWVFSTIISGSIKLLKEYFKSKFIIGIIVECSRILLFLAVGILYSLWIIYYVVPNAYLINTS